eukprot:11177073-Lingulodinium_polyedra.AAC.1
MASGSSRAGAGAQRVSVAPGLRSMETGRMADVWRKESYLLLHWPGARRSGRGENGRPAAGAGLA